MTRRVAIVGLAIALLVPASQADDEKVPTIKEIMQEAHQCRTAYVKDVRAELVKDEPNWSAVESRSRDLIRMGNLLAKNSPPKGTSLDWSNATDLYVAHATLLTDAAVRHDLDTANRHQRALTAMCATCHRAHR